MPGKMRSLVLFLLACVSLAAATVWRQDRPTSEPVREVLPVLQGQPPAFFKGNLHTHSFWSDGDDFPEMIADWYRRHGYHFLALTDHNVLSEGERWLDIETPTALRAEALKKYLARFGETWVEKRTHQARAQVRLKPLAEFRSLLEEPGKFLLIPAEEITHRFAKNPVHINAINVRDVIKPLDGNSVSETIVVNHRSLAEQRTKTRQRMLAFLNHPNFGWGVRAEDMAPVEELGLFEVFNGHAGVRNYGDETHPSSERIWDIVLALRLGRHRLPIVHGLATDDAHGYHQFGVGKNNPGRGWIMVRAPYLSAEAVVRAIEAGDFYSSTGVVLQDVRRVGDRLTLRIQAEKGVTYRTQFIATLRDVSLDSKPPLDKEGNPLPVTRSYSPEVGKVVAESDHLEPSYRLSGKELYVRAKVTSSKAHPNPYQKNDVEVAWTQPIVP